jgi:hypothetical protein
MKSKTYNFHEHGEIFNLFQRYFMYFSMYFKVFQNVSKYFDI